MGESPAVFEILSPYNLKLCFFEVCVWFQNLVNHEFSTDISVEKVSKVTLLKYYFSLSIYDLFVSIFKYRTRPFIIT